MFPQGRRPSVRRDCCPAKTAPHPPTQDRQDPARPRQELASSSRTRTSPVSSGTSETRFRYAKDPAKRRTSVHLFLGRLWRIEFHVYVIIEQSKIKSLVFQKIP